MKELKTTPKAYKFLKLSPPTLLWFVIIILTLVLVVGWNIRNSMRSNSDIDNEAVLEVLENAEENLHSSPSGKHFVKVLGSDLAVITQSTKYTYIKPVQNQGKIDKSNIAWNHNESIVAITYIAETEERTGHLLLVSHEEANKGVNDSMMRTGDIIEVTNFGIIKDIDLGKGAFYGNNEEQSFSPVVSPDGKYIAIQTDLIHQISIYDFFGNHLKDLETKYADTELFSDEMYDLEEGKYSPFLDYKWSDDGDKILYRFEGTEEYFEVSL
jgi:hypothetical protein